MKITIDVSGRSLVRWALGILFIWAALSKLGNLQDFYTSLVAYRLPVPGMALGLAAITLPWLELFCGLMLLTGYWFRTGLAWVVVLCALFAVCTAQAWARGLHIGCGCLNLEFLALDSRAKTVLESVWFAFFRSLLLLAGGLWLMRATNESGREESLKN